MRILVDLNIVMDVLYQRSPHFTLASQVWKAVEIHQVEGFLAAHSITTLFYLTSKQIGWQMATTTLTQALTVFSLTAVDENVIRQALTLGWKDFEDAVQMASALNANLDYIVTRNPQDFETHPVPVLTPAAFLTLLPPPPTPWAQPADVHNSRSFVGE